MSPKDAFHTASNGDSKPKIFSYNEQISSNDYDKFKNIDETENHMPSIEYDGSNSDEMSDM